MINSLDEMIKYCEEVAEENEKIADTFEYSLKTKSDCKECAKEHRQLVEWLRELKYYKDHQDLINKNWQALINYKEGIEKIKMRSQMYRERGESILASGMEQALDILEEVANNGKQP